MKKLLLAAAMLPSLALAVPSNIDSVTATLTGDQRDTNPDGIGIKVVGLQDGTNEDTFDFSVNWSPLSAATHPNAWMQEFYIALNPADAGDWLIDDVSIGWNVTEVVSVSGSGGVVQLGFLFEFDNDDKVDLPLEFQLQYLLGDITDENFTGAADFISTDSDLLEVQVGAKVGGLTVNAATCPTLDCDDFGTADGGSGVAGGDWVAGPVVPSDAPGMAALLSLGLIGLFMGRRVNPYHEVRVKRS